jgi:hypothetical protein
MCAHLQGAIVKLGSVIIHNNILLFSREHKNLMTKRGSLVHFYFAKTFRLVAFQFQWSIIQSWENVQSTKKQTNNQTDFIPAEVVKNNKSRLATLCHQATNRIQKRGNDIL